MLEINKGNNFEKDYFLISMQILQGPASVFVYEHLQKNDEFCETTNRQTNHYIYSVALLKASANRKH